MRVIKLIGSVIGFFASLWVMFLGVASVHAFEWTVIERASLAVGSFAAIVCMVACGALFVATISEQSND